MTKALKGLFLAAALTFTMQASFASWTDWGYPEPVMAVNPIDVKLQAYEAQISQAYVNGLLDPMELAELKREILAARDVEALSKSSSGFTPNSFRHVKKYVDQLGYLINGHIIGNTNGTFAAISAEPTVNQYSIIETKTVVETKTERLPSGTTFSN